MLDIVKQLKKDGVDILLISSTLPTELFPYATYHLYFCSYENTYDKIASFASRVSLQYLLDALFACIMFRNLFKEKNNITPDLEKMKNEVRNRANAVSNWDK